MLILDNDDLEFVYWDTLYMIFKWECTPAWFSGTLCTWFLYDNPPQPGLLGHPVPDFCMRIHPRPGLLGHPVPDFYMWIHPRPGIRNKLTQYEI